MWEQLGSPSSLRLAELGPGRGTLMADMLRVLRQFPPVMEALQISMVEISPGVAAVACR